MIIQICVGSACHLKGSEEIAAMFEKALEEHGLLDEVTLAACFCVGRCSHNGVTVQVDDAICNGVTKEGFDAFFEKNVLEKLGCEGGSACRTV